MSITPARLVLRSASGVDAPVGTLLELEDRDGTRPVLWRPADGKYDHVQSMSAFGLSAVVLGALRERDVQEVFVPNPASVCVSRQTCTSLCAFAERAEHPIWGAMLHVPWHLWSRYGSEWIDDWLAKVVVPTDAPIITISVTGVLAPTQDGLF